MTIPDAPRVQKPSDIARYFEIPSEGIIVDSHLCQWKNAFATIHKQSCDSNECYRPAIRQHQLVLYRGATEHGEVSFNKEAWRRYSKRHNEWYIAPAGERVPLGAGNITMHNKVHRFSASYYRSPKKKQKY